MQRKLKSEARWSENLVSVTNENLVESEVLSKEKAELDKQWPIIFEKMKGMEPEIKAAFQEYELQKGCSNEPTKIQNAFKHLQELKWGRDGLKVANSKRSVEINRLLERLTQVVINELTDARPVTGQPLGLLHREINNLVTKRIFVQVGLEDFENEYGRYKKPIVRNNLTQLEEAEKLLLATIDKIRQQTFNSVSEILDILDQGQDEYLKIDFAKCSKDEFSMENYIHILRVEGETSGASEVIWPWELKTRGEETRIFEKQAEVIGKVSKVFGK